MAQITARVAELDALEGLKDANVASLTKEGDSQRFDLIADSREKFESEKARIEQLKVIHDAIEAESNSKILEMTEAAIATRERANATVVDLEAEVVSIQLETQARVDELDEQSKQPRPEDVALPVPPRGGLWCAPKGGTHVPYHVASNS